MSKTADSSVTVKNIEAAFAGESMAHIKYLYFARVCRAHGDVVSARIFEDTAAQEVQHALGHMDLLYPREALDPVQCLDLAIAGETYEYTEMYPQFRHLAEQEGNQAAVREFGEQIAESHEHAERFKALLVKAAKRFAALTKVEERHARRYQDALRRVRA
jgi:rubrerythrin